MDEKTGAAMQRDAENEDSEERAMAEIVETRIKDVHTAMPGIVRSFDAATQTAQVQPATQRLFIGVGWRNLPPCVDVPVQFPGWGDYVMTFPVKAGDECQLNFNERAIDFWWQKGGVQKPSEYRLHDLSDAFALMGFSSKQRAISGFSMDQVEIRRRDGTGPKFVLNEIGAFVGDIVGATPIVLAPALAAIAAYATAIQVVADPTNVATPALIAALAAPGAVTLKAMGA